MLTSARAHARARTPAESIYLNCPKMSVNIYLSGVNALNLPAGDLPAVRACVCVCALYAHPPFKFNLCAAVSSISTVCGAQCVCVSVNSFHHVCGVACSCQVMSMSRCCVFLHGKCCRFNKIGFAAIPAISVSSIKIAEYVNWTTTCNDCEAGEANEAVLCGGLLCDFPTWILSYHKNDCADWLHWPQNILWMCLWVKQKSLNLPTFWSKFSNQDGKISIKRPY